MGQQIWNLNQSYLPRYILKNTMYSKFLMLSMAVVGSFASPSETVDPDTKASSPLINFGCQCSPLTFRDAKGEVQGNCRTVDGTGAQWCYVDSAYSSSCQDLVPSKRFPNNPWSYEACATPSIGSVLCPTAVVPVAPVAPVAPAAPAHPTYPAAPTDLHPVAPHHPEVVVGAGPAGPGLGGVLGGNYDPESIGDIRLGDASSKINLPPSK